MQFAVFCCVFCRFALLNRYGLHFEQRALRQGRAPMRLAAWGTPFFLSSGELNSPSGKVCSANTCDAPFGVVQAAASFPQVRLT